MCKYLKAILILVFILNICSCGSSKGSRYYAASKPAAREKKSSAGMIALEEAEADEDSIAKTDRTKSLEQKNRMVIYNSYLSINVKSIKNSITEIRQAAEKYKGYFDKIETYNSYKNAKIVLRIPVADFDKVVSSIESLGTVTSKSISAEDITDKYTDMKLRLESLKKIRERLYSLLKRAKKPKERVKILKEINRITSQIDSINTSMKYYRNKADYSTIEINLTAYKTESTAKYIPSPFRWISSLSIYNKSTKIKGFFSDKFKFVKPSGYFNKLKQYKENKENFIFVTPGYTSGIRAGYVENYPTADVKFWKEALFLDSKNRLYSIEKETQVNSKYIYELIVFKAVSGVYYSIAFTVEGDEILIAEAYFKNKEEYEKKFEIFKKFIKDMEYK